MKTDNVIVDKSKAFALRIIKLYQYLCEGNKRFLRIFVPVELLVCDYKKFKGYAILRHKLEHLLKIRHAFGKARIKFRFFRHIRTY